MHNLWPILLTIHVFWRKLKSKKICQSTVNFNLKHRKSSVQILKKLSTEHVQKKTLRMLHSLSHFVILFLLPPNIKHKQTFTLPQSLVNIWEFRLWYRELFRDKWKGGKKERKSVKDLAKEGKIKVFRLIIKENSFVKKRRKFIVN